ncbi:MAG TPA: hypothetical protein VKR32_18585, partial [Puia sp.]|nr:hypothetical protein [Puia sp.]
MKKNVIAFFLLAGIFSAKGQFTRFTVQFTDKNGTPYSLDNPTSYLSEQAITRRSRQHLHVDSTDLPISPAYLDSILSIPGVQFLNLSKWFNQVLVRISDSTVLEKINAFPFVRKSQPVAASLLPPPTLRRRGKLEGMMSLGDKKYSAFPATWLECGPDTNFYSYGYSYLQIHMHNGEFLHNLGYHGENMTIAILDAGFLDYLSNPVFDSVRLGNQVLGTYDYVNLKTSVNEENVHGAYCFSILAANLPGQMIGSSPRSKYYLLKTEDVNSEYPVEEQNWVAAAEFADSAGADIISTSLGYDYFD